MQRVHRSILDSVDRAVMAPMAGEEAPPAEAASELTRKRLRELARASGLQGLPTKGGEAMDLAAYSEAQQQLYFLGQVREWVAGQGRPLDLCWRRDTTRPF